MQYILVLYTCISGCKMKFLTLVIYLFIYIDRCLLFILHFVQSCTMILLVLIHWVFGTFWVQVFWDVLFLCLLEVYDISSIPRNTYWCRLSSAFIFLIIHLIISAMICRKTKSLNYSVFSNAILENFKNWHVNCSWL